MSKLLPGITVVIPSIPTRKRLLRRALDSVIHQTMPAAAVSVAVDLNREGAAKTRQRAFDAVQTRWTAFLDDDDELLPNHLGTLLSAAENQGGSPSYLWSRYRVAYPNSVKFQRAAGHNPSDSYRFARPEGDPYPLGRGTFEQWNDEQPAQTTITTMVRTELAREVGGFYPNAPVPEDGEIGGQRAGEDWDFTLRCRVSAGLSGMRHVPVTTWTWHHHGANTSGMPDRW